MKIGFVGAGAITSAMVSGLCSRKDSPYRIRLSPRNAETAEELAGRFENVSVCRSNQEVVEQSETIVLAIRPQVAEEVLSGLRFSPDQIAISLVAGFSTQRIAALVAPASRIWRAIPLPSVARRRGPIALYPAGGFGEELFAELGQVVALEREDQLNACSTATSTMATYFGFAGHIASWMVGKEIAEAAAREYVASMFAGLAEGGIEGANSSFEELAAAHATPGGLNEQVFREVTSAGVFDTLRDALDRVHLRATGQSA